MELHHFHIGNARTRAPRHRDAVAGRPARRSAELIDPPRPAGRQHSGARGMRLDAPGRLVERVHPPDPARTRITRRLVPPGDQIDAGLAGQQGDVAMRGGGLQQRGLHCPASGIVDMDDAPVRMPALARQMQPRPLGIEGHTQRGQSFDCRRRAADDEFHCLAPVQPGPGDHGIAHVVLESVAGIEHRGDPALRPGGRSGVEPALGQHQHPAVFGQRQRRAEPRRARADDDDIVGRAGGGWIRGGRLRGRGHRALGSGSAAAGSATARPLRWSGGRRHPQGRPRGSKPRRSAAPAPEPAPGSRPHWCGPCHR